MGPQKKGYTLEEKNDKVGLCTSGIVYGKVQDLGNQNVFIQGIPISIWQHLVCSQENSDENREIPVIWNTFSMLSYT